VGRLKWGADDRALNAGGQGGCGRVIWRSRARSPSRPIDRRREPGRIPGEAPGEGDRRTNSSPPRAAASIWNKLLAIFGGRMPTPEQFPAAEAGDPPQGRPLQRQGRVPARSGRPDQRDGRPRTRPPQGSLRRGHPAPSWSRVKGIGRWSAEMFLIFHLGRKGRRLRGRSPGSGGAIQVAYGMEELPGP